MSHALSYDERLALLFADLKHHVSTFGFTTTINVTFSVDAKAWTKMRDKGQLGHLYGTDLSNYLYRQGILRAYAMPIVGDRDRASRGRKRIRVEFRFENERPGRTA